MSKSRGKVRKKTDISQCDLVSHQVLVLAQLGVEDGQALLQLIEGDCFL